MLPISSANSYPQRCIATSVPWPTAVGESRGLAASQSEPNSAKDYELSAEEASDLIAALGGTSQQRAGYREHLGGR
eukprot:Skav217721  [mRNA]  locus=scaffold2294:354638:358822:- [translate_table: standard]